MSTRESRNKSILQRYNSFMVKSRKGCGDIELITGIEITETEWEYVDYIDETDPIDKMIVLVPMFDWGETCPICEIGYIEDQYNDYSAYLCCSNCEYLPPWRYGSYKWQHGKPKEISNLSVQNLLDDVADF